MLTRQQALDIIKDKKLQPNVINHSMQVNKISNYLARKLKDKGVEINLHLVDVGSLLHDIGRTVNHDTHGEEGERMLKEMGEEEVSKIIIAHGLYPDCQPKTWEEKIVYSADKRVRHDEIVSLQERMDDLFERYSYIDDDFSTLISIAKKIEKEIFDIIGWDKENLEEVE